MGALILICAVFVAWLAGYFIFIGYYTGKRELVLKFKSILDANLVNPPPRAATAEDLQELDQNCGRILRGGAWRRRNRRTTPRVKGDGDGE